MDDVEMYTEHMTVLRERDVARAELRASRVAADAFRAAAEVMCSERDEARAALLQRERENAELRARVETSERLRSGRLIEESIARAALVALLDGLGRDDQPRREAIDKARALVASWGLP